MGHSGATWTGGKQGTQTDREGWNWEEGAGVQALGPPGAQKPCLCYDAQSLTAAGVHPARYLNRIPARPVH